MEDPRGREKRMGRVVIWRWTTPIGGEPELAFLPFPPFLLLFSFFSLSLVATQEGSGYFWNLPIHTLTRRSVNSTTRFDILFLSSPLLSSPKTFFESSRISSWRNLFLPTPCESTCGTREQSFHRISLWILTGSKPRISTLGYSSLESSKLGRRIFAKARSTRLSERSMASRLSSVRCQKKKKRKEGYVVAFRGLGFGVDFVVDRVSRCTRSSPRTPSTDATWSRTKSRIWSTSTTRLRISSARSPRISSSPPILIPPWCSSIAPRDCPRSRSLWTDASNVSC